MSQLEMGPTAGPLDRSQTSRPRIPDPEGRGSGTSLAQKSRELLEADAVLFGDFGGVARATGRTGLDAIGAGARSRTGAYCCHQARYLAVAWGRSVDVVHDSG